MEKEKMQAVMEIINNVGNGNFSDLGKLLLEQGYLGNSLEAILIGKKEQIIFYAGSMDVVFPFQFADEDGKNITYWSNIILTVRNDGEMSADYAGVVYDFEECKDENE